jgi:hypothetical protein
MFIAPISLHKQFSKTFVSYTKYEKKLQDYLKNKRSLSYTNITKIPIQMIELKKSQSCPDLHKLTDLGGLSQIMKIFDISSSLKKHAGEPFETIDIIMKLVKLCNVKRLGEVVAEKQGWVEGALSSVEKISLFKK